MKHLFWVFILTVNYVSAIPSSVYHATDCQLRSIASDRKTESIACHSVTAKVETSTEEKEIKKELNYNQLVHVLRGLKVDLHTQKIIKDTTSLTSMPIGEYFPNWRPDQSELSEPLLQWLKEQSKRIKNNEKPEPYLLQAEGKESWIVLRPIRENEWMIFMKGDLRADLKKLKASFGLSPAESEIAYWLSQGRTREEIQYILGSQSRLLLTQIGQIRKKMKVDDLNGIINLSQQALQQSKISITAEEIEIKKIQQKYSLRDREAAVAYWVVQGETKDEIANRLNISSETVRQYINIYLYKAGLKEGDPTAKPEGRKPKAVPDTKALPDKVVAQSTYSNGIVNQNLKRPDENSSPIVEKTPLRDVKKDLLEDASLAKKRSSSFTVDNITHKIKEIHLAAQKRLSEDFPSWRPDQSELPEPLLQWLKEQSKRIKNNEKPEPYLLQAEGKESWIVLRPIRENEWMIFMKGDLRADLKKLKASFGLSPAESEIAYWLSQGRTREEVQVIMDLNYRLLKTQIGNIYAKMKVREISQIAILAEEVLDGGQAIIRSLQQKHLLTERQAQVGYLTRKGYSISDLAQKFEIKPDTVKLFLKQYYQKTGEVPPPKQEMQASDSSIFVNVLPGLQIDLDEYLVKKIPPELLKILKEYFPNWKPEQEPIPNQLLQWIKEQSLRIKNNEKPLPYSHSATGIESAIILRPHILNNWMLFIKGDLRKEIASLRAKFLLSATESEIVYWFAQGKTKEEILYILSIRSDSFRQYLRSINQTMKTKDLNETIQIVKEFLNSLKVPAQEQKQKPDFSEFSDVLPGVLINLNSLLIKDVSPSALEIIKRDFPNWPPHENVLPVQLINWLRQQIGKVTKGERPDPYKHLVAGVANWYLLRPYYDNQWMIFIRGNPKNEIDELTKKFLLSPTEAEIVYWLSQGKSRKEIQYILHTKLETIHTLTGNIYRKLGTKDLNEVASIAKQLLAERASSLAKNDPIVTPDYTKFRNVLPGFLLDAESFSFKGLSADSNDLLSSYFLNWKPENQKVPEILIPWVKRQMERALKGDRLEDYRHKSQNLDDSIILRPLNQKQWMIFLKGNLHHDLTVIQKRYPTLEASELEVAYWFSQGKSLAETQYIMHERMEAIEFYVSSVVKKLSLKAPDDIGPSIRSLLKRDAETKAAQAIRDFEIQVLQNAFNLKKREAEVVYWLADGGARGDITKFLGISSDELSSYLSIAAQKMKAKDLQHALTMAREFIKSNDEFIDRERTKPTYAKRPEGTVKTAKFSEHANILPGLLIDIKSFEVKKDFSIAKQILEKDFPDWKVAESPLPPPVVDWLREQVGTIRNKGKPMNFFYKAHNGSNFLMLRPYDQQHWALFVDDDNRTQLYNLSRRFGLTPTESEIAYWLAHRKNRAQIEYLVHANRATTQTLMSYIYRKIGTKNPYDTMLAVREFLNLGEMQPIPYLEQQPELDLFKKTFNLTFNEARVALMSAEGFSNEEIKDKLGISRSTVHVHLSHIYQKLDAESNASAVLKLLKALQQDTENLNSERIVAMLSHKYQLSMQEAYMAYWLAYGKQHGDTAMIMEITSYRVTELVKNVYRKLQVSRPTQIAIKMFGVMRSYSSTIESEIQYLQSLTPSSPGILEIYFWAMQGKATPTISYILKLEESHVINSLQIITTKLSSDSKELQKIKSILEQSSNQKAERSN